MSTEKKFQTMLEMQIELNDYTVPGWREKNLAWQDAIWIECAELMDPIGWKWWKEQKQNLEQAKMEMVDKMVDIWHFGMSLDMTKSEVKNLVEHYSFRSHIILWSGDSANGSEYIRDIVGSASYYNRFDATAFFRLMSKLNMTLDNLYSRSVCKNVLNKFRQDNGYKEGRYLKQWFGEEDNVWLENIVADLDMNHPDFKEKLYEQMKIDYEEAKRDIWVG